jgi:putative acetyltransferase
MTQEFRIRTERPADADAIADILGTAFASRAPEGATPVEVGLVERLRTSHWWLDDYALVAESAGVAVGYSTCTLGGVAGVEALGLGPIGVVPALHRQGIGTALVRTHIALAEGDGYPYIALLGEPDYYSRFGFVAGASVEILPPVAQWRDYFQVLPLSAFGGAPRGVFHYAAPFDDL